MVNVKRIQLETHVKRQKTCPRKLAYVLIIISTQPLQFTRDTKSMENIKQEIYH